MVAAACGGDDSGGTATDTTDAGNLIDNDLGDAVDKAQSGTTVEGDTTDTTVADKGAIPKPATEPKSIEEWEELWAEQRAPRTSSGSRTTAGVCRRTARRCSAPTASRSTCRPAAPAGATPRASPTPRSRWAPRPRPWGTQATAVNINYGAQVIMNYYADQGIFKDSEGKTRRVNEIIKDDGYDPARTIPLVDELIDSEKVFDVMTQGCPAPSRSTTS